LARRLTVSVALVRSTSCQRPASGIAQTLKAEGRTEPRMAVSSKSWAWPMAFRRRRSSWLQSTITFWAWTALTASSATVKSPAFCVGAIGKIVTAPQFR
jgi:hypothetical protein